MDGTRSSARQAAWGLALLAAGAAGARPLRAQAGPAVLPIDIAVAPAKVMPGGTVTITGSAALLGGGKPVTLEVVGPNAATSAAWTVQPGRSGAYGATFAKTGAPGKYVVTAVAPDGKGKASATFAVVGAAVIPDDVARLADTLALLSRQVVAAVQKGVDALPPLPEKAEAADKVMKARVAAGTLAAQVATLRQRMTAGFAARAKVSGSIPEWDAYVGELSTWEGNAETARLKLEEMATPTAAVTETCAGLDRFGEMLSFASEAVGLLKAPFDLTSSYFGSKIPGGLVARTGIDGITPVQRAGLVEALKLTPMVLKGPAAVVTAVPALVLDAAKFLVVVGFDRYCVKWEGPITGTFLGESFTKLGERFFDYTTELDGKLLLLYGKTAPPASVVKLSGYIVGTGRFAVRDNPAPIARLAPGTVVFHRVVSPPGGRYWDEVGAGVQSGLPHGFRIPVTGLMAGDSILLALGAPTYDFAPTVKGVSTWVIMPWAGLVPEVILAPIGLQKAHPIIERAIRRHPVLRIATSGNVMIAEGKFARDTTNAQRTARVRTVLSIKACNPACVPVPLTWKPR